MCHGIARHSRLKLPVRRLSQHQGPPFPFQKSVFWSTALDATGAMQGKFSSPFLDHDGAELFEVTQEMRGIRDGR